MKKIYFPILTILFSITYSLQLYAQPSPTIYTSWEKGFLNSLKNSHDLALPSWGPYSDKFNGISHVPQANNGFRFDVVVQPSLYLRNLTPLANVKRESGYHPWQANADLSYFSYRFELEWKDRVFCDVSFSKVDEQSRLIKASFVNNTSSNRSLSLNIFSTITFPYSKSIKALLPANVEWQKATDYTSFTDSIISWNYNLVYNGQLRGYVNDDNAVGHTAIVTGKYAGGKLNYQLLNPRKLVNGVMIFRYKTVSETAAKVQVSVDGKPLKTIDFPNAKDYSLMMVEVSDLPKTQAVFSLKFINNAALRLDGFALIEKRDLSTIKFENIENNFLPKQIPAGISNAILLKHKEVNEFYGMVWNDQTADLRELFDDNPDQALFQFNNLVKHGKGFENTNINGINKGWFKNVFAAPIVLKPNQKAVRYAYVVAGKSEREVIDKLNNFNANWAMAETIYQRQNATIDYSKHNRAGIKYQFSQQLMEATTLTNLIYPTFTANQFTKHTTPGKKWSSLYTWDSGFIGLGYASINVGRALESLNAYTMDSTEQSAFLSHGTPLPVQGYLFAELWNITQNEEYLRYYYPRLKRYYSFLGGAESSSTRKLKSNLIKTWDIFYNSGGWDDYSPQVFVHKNKLQDFVAPTINTAHQIRFAKLLRMAAWQLGYPNDIAQYTSDISMYSKALQENAWDEVAGYYGYVKHDPDGVKTTILRDSTGVNLNMGLDGCSPLIAGICTPKQQRQLLQHLFTKGQLWTDQGITAIDQSAPYYSKDGYWNGRVWMPHQWFFWKTMLDLNEPERAVQIAVTALEVWKRETDDTYNCWENFANDTGNGGGWHQFGALSSPVLNWYASLFKPGTITHGFDVWPTAQKFNSANDAFKGTFKCFADQQKKTTAMLLCLNDKYNYIAKCNGKNMPLTKIFDGLYSIKVDLGDENASMFMLEVNRTK